LFSDNYGAKNEIGTTDRTDGFDLSSVDIVIKYIVKLFKKENL